MSFKDGSPIRFEALGISKDKQKTTPNLFGTNTVITGPQSEALANQPKYDPVKAVERDLDVVARVNFRDAMAARGITTPPVASVWFPGKKPEGSPKNTQ